MTRIWKLDYNRARYMDPGTGRFWSRDTYAGNNEDSLSLHKYLYAQCDPVDHIDPSGHDIGDLLAIADIFLHPLLDDSASCFECKTPGHDYTG